MYPQTVDNQKYFSLFQLLPIIPRRGLASLILVMQKRRRKRQCCRSGCLSRIPDPNFFHQGSPIRIKEFKYFNPKIGFQALGNMILVVHSGSGSRIRVLTFYPSRIQDPRVKKAPDPGSGSATLVQTNHSCNVYVVTFTRLMLRFLRKKPTQFRATWLRHRWT
jgi:hypothetical protein